MLISTKSFPRLPNQKRWSTPESSPSIAMDTDVKTNLHHVKMLFNFFRRNPKLKHHPTSFHLTLSAYIKLAGNLSSKVDSVYERRRLAEETGGFRRRVPPMRDGSVAGKRWRWLRKEMAVAPTRDGGGADERWCRHLHHFVHRGRQKDCYLN
ncbi:hypothetical protein L1987_43242 [Smallanthus sonchifolius]|uniref:Uncharacterized protein n=1 Tax=Smallanthus sonchifolius TaxID=185202 RepID=A0ACB9GKW5_9ASTR|nr:hypothetical protein L1987_43242 [Smallanthus sonchifolius]